MIKSRHILCAFFLLCIAAALCGCGDDKAANETNQPVTTEQLARVRTMNDSTIIPLLNSLLAGGMDFVDSVDAGDFGFDLGKMAAPEHDSTWLTYHVLSGWWEGYLETEGIDEDDSVAYHLVVRDSLQFRSNGGQPQFVPDANTDYLRNIGRLRANGVAPDGDELTIDWRSDMIYDDLLDDTITIDGPITLAIDVKFDTLGQTIEGQWLFALDVESFQVPKPINEDDLVCPLAGVVTYSVRENLSSQFVTGEATFVTWSVEIVVLDESHFDVTITAGAIEFETYTVEIPCDGISEGIVVADKRLREAMVSALKR